MHNPWLDLPQQPPFVLPDDAAPIAAFNQGARDELLVHTELLPEPFIGRRDASIVLLSLNPGYSPDDAAINAQPGFIAMLRRNMQHQPNPYPFYHLDPAWDGPGAWWWGRKLKALLSLFPRALVAHNLLCIEYFRTTRSASATIACGCRRKATASYSRARR